MKKKVNESILIVDDNAENLTILRKILTKNGYHIRPAINGKIALKTIEKDIPDLILLDIKMPEIDGFTVCQTLKSNLITKDIPIIFLTALHDISDKTKAFSYGAVDYITKPFNENEILARIRTHLKLRSVIVEKEESNMMLNAILKSIPDTIVTVDKNLNIINANNSLSDICYAHDKNNKVYIQKILKKGIGPCYEMLQKTLETKKSLNEYRTKCSCEFKSNRTVVLNTTPLIDNNNEFSGAVLVIRDITKLASLEEKIIQEKSFKNIITNNDKMHKIITLIQQTSDLEINFLVTGESGTGKELIADALHYSSSRASEPFVKVNCAALSENLLESELFGHVRGAFTGAICNRIGRIEAAEKGSLFLDEIGDVSIAFQAKLLRFIEQKEYERIGDSKTLKANVRIIAATNKNLEECVNNGTFRKDLFYRLKGIIFNLPPLKERIDDIPLLVINFIKIFRKQNKKNIKGVSDEVNKILMSYHWPGNIRELKQAIEYSCALCNDEIIHPDHLPSELLCSPKKILISEKQELLKNDSEKNHLLQILNRTDWNKAKAARLLGISRGTLYNKLMKYQIEKQE